MLYRRLFAAILFFCSLARPAYSVQVANVTSPNGSKWCWAAAIASASTFYNFTTAPNGVVWDCCDHQDSSHKYLTIPAGVSWDCVSCCMPAEPCLQYEAGSANIRNIINDWAFTYNEAGQVPLATLQAHCLSNPALALYCCDAESKGHMVVICEAYNNDIYFMDPFDGASRYLSYSSFESHAQYGSWIWTYLLTGCSFGDLQKLIVGEGFKTWGGIKELFLGECDASAGAVLQPNGGFYEARSEKYPRIAWPSFADSNYSYDILRCNSADSLYSIIEQRDYNDTVFVDSTAIAGNAYSYRVINETADTLKYSDEFSSGMLCVAELYFYDINGEAEGVVTSNGDTLSADYSALLAHMAIEGDLLYIACGDKIKKINISNAYNPIEIDSRDISFLTLNGKKESIVDIGMGQNNNLAVLTDHCLIAIDKVNSSMPISSIYWLDSSDQYRTGYCNSLAMKGDIAFVASQEGLYAISLVNPTAMEIWGHYAGFGQSSNKHASAVELVEDYLYIDFYYDSYGNELSEILKPRIYGAPQKSVYFDLISSDHDSLASINRLAALTGFRMQVGNYWAMAGNAKGYYAMGKISDTTYAVWNTSSPNAPALLKSFAAPLAICNYSNGVYGSHYSSYEFDDKYLYVGVTSVLRIMNSSVYAYDLYSSDEDAVFAIGDLNMGQRKCPSIISKGDYLYYFDKVKNDRAYHRLQIYKKARSCDANMQISMELDHIEGYYELGQTAKISWNCTGCPIQLDIKLIEDGTKVQTLAVLKKDGIADLSSNSRYWSVAGISSDQDNHLYQIQIMARNIDGMESSKISSSFHIVEELLPGGDKNPIIIVECSLDDGERKEYLLPFTKNEVSDGSEPLLWIFPKNPRAEKGSISIALENREKSQIHIDLMDLLSVETKKNGSVSIVDNKLSINGSKCDIKSVDVPEKRFPLKAANDESVTITKCLSARVDEKAILFGQSISYEYSIDKSDDSHKRYYMLRYKLSVADSDGDLALVPKVFAIKSAYPNPFNPSTTIEFHVPRQSKIELCVFDVSGRLIATLEDRICKAGIYKAVWDGRNINGDQVTSGVYFCRLKAGGSIMLSKKLILLR